MFLTGYHGTTLNRAKNILKEKKFTPSSKDTEWLGDGIYYYFDIDDAYKWRNSNAILHSVIKIDNDEYLDIDTEEGALVYNLVLALVASLQSKKINTASTVEKNQCAVMRLLWQKVPEIKVIAASFPAYKTVLKTLIDKRTRRKEFCVRNNDCIKHTYLIRKEDLDD